jgi:Protein of unknown function (DUF2793)
MSSTPHLALPLLAAAQAQKHVTHNEALASLDALVHLAVKERNRTLAPGSPAEGDRYLIGAGATGAFAGHDDEVALFDLGLWRFFAPGPGWRAYVEAENRIIVFDGTQWHELNHYIKGFDNLEKLGIGAAADSLNRFSATLNAALFVALEAAEGGTGDLRFVLNKGQSANVLSQLYQRGFVGRAETGLIGSDNFAIRVSADGSQWRDALLIDNQSGIVSFPSGLSAAPGTNLLINSAFRVNQRGFGGGNLAAGSFCFDRWKAGAGGCSLNLAADGTVTLTGAVDQVVQAAQAAASMGLSNLAGATLTLSLHDPSSPLTVTIGTKSAVIPSGQGPRSATVTLDPTENGNIPVRLQAASACSFKRVKLEVGPAATPWIGEPIEFEELRCRRYYQRVAASGGTPAILGVLGQRVGANAIHIPYSLPVPMQAAPTIITSGLAWSGGSPVVNSVGFYDNAGGAWVTMTGALTISTAVASSPSAVVLKLQAGTSFTGAAGAVGHLHIGSSGFIALQAEL